MRLPLRLSRRLLLILGVLLASLLLIWWMQRPPRVEVLRLQTAPLVSSLQVSARVAALSRVDLGSTLTGRIVAVAVREGDSVRAGQPLIGLESDELAAVLQQARASERAADARLAGLRSSGRKSLQASIAQAQSVLANARADLQRQQSLLAQGFVSAARLDEARRKPGGGAGATGERRGSSPGQSGLGRQRDRPGRGAAGAGQRRYPGRRGQVGPGHLDGACGGAGAGARSRTRPDRATRAEAADAGAERPDRTAGPARRALPGAIASGAARPGAGRCLSAAALCRDRAADRAAGGCPARFHRAAPGAHAAGARFSAGRHESVRRGRDGSA
ncbi:MAG: biotin/lipoyl-binding protein [Uliginosibacterium sp.]|nr:biotin/lipoyl-binding protein [Uliginosibacterium sp.]